MFVVPIHPKFIFTIVLPTQFILFLLADGMLSEVGLGDLRWISVSLFPLLHAMFFLFLLLLASLFLHLPRNVLLTHHSPQLKRKLYVNLHFNFSVLQFLHLLLLNFRVFDFYLVKRTFCSLFMVLPTLIFCILGQINCYCWYTENWLPAHFLLVLMKTSTFLFKHIFVNVHFWSVLYGTRKKFWTNMRAFLYGPNKNGKLLVLFPFNYSFNYPSGTVAKAFTASNRVFPPSSTHTYRLILPNFRWYTVPLITLLKVRKMPKHWHSRKVFIIKGNCNFRLAD